MSAHPILPVMPVLAVSGIFLALLWALILLGRGGAYRHHAMHGLVITGLIASFFALNLRYMKEEQAENAVSKNIDVLFVVDDTISMYCKDYGGDTRMKGAVDTCRRIMQELDGSNFALIRYENVSQIMAPFTQDTDSLTDALDAISVPSYYYAKGTSLNTPYSDIASLLKSSAKKKDRKTYLFFMSDGEITDESQLRSYADLKPYLDGGAILGFGSTEGAKVPKGEDSYFYDYSTGDYAVSKLSEDTLKKLADDLGVDYIHAVTDADTDYLMQGILAGSMTVQSGKKTVYYSDMSYYRFAWLVLLFLVLDGIMFIFGDRWHYGRQ